MIDDNALIQLHAGSLYCDWAEKSKRERIKKYIRLP